MQLSTLRPLMLSMAHALSVEAVLRSIVDGIATCTDVVLVRIWLFGPGDVCGSCRFAAECPDRTQCLHLVASAGQSRHGKDQTGLGGGFRRFPLGVRKIGMVAQRGEPMLLRELEHHGEWIADPAWAASEGVQTFAAQPLVFQGKVLGVLGLFDRGVLDDQHVDWLRHFADHAAVSIINARAFEEIEQLKKRLEQDNAYLQQEVRENSGAQGILGSSNALRKVLHQIDLVAPTDSVVLIHGESGTGKELVARALHERSARRGRPLVRVNCGAVSDTLFESEFFGHVKGAFTGALRDRVGRFELADGGTIFLDEIGEVPLALQPKLLRVLQEREFERVGEERTRRVDVRILAATNRDLRREVDAGRFREDLFYRLSVFPVELPPLRDRRDDIPILALHFINQVAARIHRNPPRVTRTALEELTAYDWPGNVRELQNVVERAVIVCGNGPLRFVVEPSAPRVPPPQPAPLRGPDTILTRAQLKALERSSLQAALAATHGQVFGADGAAALLGMNPTTLASRLKALRITPPRRAPR